ncbi:hypothetical protein C8F04DRAFT_1100193 [Mycena alexandri]|uniref:Uncharacterized protein n=1 Tax=Mycena alexandri TaxID=1745969 RepID=A0AAD6SW81_9AGAR|nr:hypothetical protein C8F04DRAFT_1100193 [Mycena alexandri]
MHGAAFPLVFRDVWWKLDGPEEINGALVCRMLEREEECLGVIRSLTLSTRRVPGTYNPDGPGSEDAETKITPVLLEALARFPVLREFAWDERIGPMPISVLQTLLSANKQLETLRIGAAYSAISPLDLSGFLNLVDLEVYCDSASLDVSTVQILCPDSLRFLALNLYTPAYFHSDDVVSATFEALVGNSRALSVLRLGGLFVGFDFGGLESSYTFLHTISLKLITPPVGTGLDFIDFPALTSLTLHSIWGIPNIGSLPICIRTPHTLRNLNLYQIEPAAPGTSILGGVHFVSLDSLVVGAVPLTQGDADSIFAPQISTGTISSASAAPSPCTLKRLELRNHHTQAFMAGAMRSSRPFPALLYFGLDINGQHLLDSLPLFLGRTDALQRLDLRYLLYTMEGAIPPSFLSPPSLPTAFRAAANLRHISLPINRLHLGHPIFHKLGDALQHVSSLALELLISPTHRQMQDMLTDLDHIHDTVKAFSKFPRLQYLVINLDLNPSHPILFSDADLEQLAAHVPTLRTFTFRKTWEIQRNAITGELLRIVRE